MALITCPECGKEVSDKAKTCIHCGSPLGEPDHTLKIKIRQIGTTEPFSYVFTDDSTGKKLAEGHGGQIIKLNIDKPTTIRCHYGMAKDGLLNYIPHENAKYNVVMSSGLFRMQIVFQEVDHIDAD